MSVGPWTMSVRMQNWQLASNSVILPAGVIRPIFAGADVNSVPSVNHRLPSEPLVMARVWLSAVGTLNCFSIPAGAASAAALPSDNARQARPTSKRLTVFIPASLGLPERMAVLD